VKLENLIKFIKIIKNKTTSEKKLERDEKKKLQVIKAELKDLHNNITKWY